MALKELQVKYTERRQRPFKLSDGEGLHLLVKPNGSKLWRLKYRFDGKEKLLSFGKYPDVTLAMAREKRREAKAGLAEGIDPGAACADEPTPMKPCPPKTFEVIARAWHANREEGLDPAHAARVEPNAARLDSPRHSSPAARVLDTVQGSVDLWFGS